MGGTAKIACCCSTARNDDRMRATAVGQGPCARPRGLSQNGYEEEGAHKQEEEEEEDNHAASEGG
eukprot:6520621-Pyramimonas_sp.AAC.1